MNAIIRDDLDIIGNNVNIIDDIDDVDNIDVV